MRSPENVTELRTFLGMINYYNKFLPNASTMFSPLYALLHKDVAWKWSTECQSAFDGCKAALTSNLLLVHYDHKKKVTLACDASPFGLGAVLSHIMDSGQDRPIAYASRTLTTAEKGYSQLEREALAIIFALKHFQQYLYGREFTIITDHKPLISLFNPNSEIPAMAAARIQRWALLLSAFRYDIQYRKGGQHCNADVLSRFPDHDETIVENNIYRLSSMDDLPLTAGDIRNATRKDQVLGKVLNKVKYGWTNQIEEDLVPYYRRKDQLSAEEDCLLWGTRVIIPKKHRQYLLDLLHDCHQGVTKMKAIARSHIWWPNLDKDIEQISQGCTSCQRNQNMPATSTLQSWTWPKVPWNHVHVDFAQKQDMNFLILTDAHSKWIDVIRMRNITANSTIDTLRDSFARYGIPRELVSDNGPQFTSCEFQTFMSSNGVKHTLVPPYHPSSNGAAERSVQSFKAALKRMDSDTSDYSSLNQKISRYLLVQHSTPHVTTGVTPSSLFLGRELRTRWTLLHSDIVSKVEAAQYKQKMYHDRAHSSVHTPQIGEEVFVRNYGLGSKWNEGVIMDKTSTRTWSVSTPKGSQNCHSDQIRANMRPFQEANKSESNIATDVCFPPTGQLEEPADHNKPGTFTKMIDGTNEHLSNRTFEHETDPRRNPHRQRKAPDRLNL